MVTRAAKFVLALEPYLLTLTLFLFWLSPVHLSYLLFFLPTLVARLIVHRRLWTPTFLDGLLVAFVVVMFINDYIAPYSRSFWITSRGFLGIALTLSIVDLMRRRAKGDHLVMATVLLGLLVGVLAVGSSQWTEKSLQLSELIKVLPTLRNFPGSEKGFNVNEIGGAMAWLLPIAGGIAIYEWRERRDKTLRLYATLTFFLLWFALFLGQSRFAIFGGIAAMGFLIFTLIPRGWWRRLALLVLVAFTVIELTVFVGILSPTAQLSERDEDSWSGRIAIWGSAVEIIQDYPLSGVGMNKFRLSNVRERYPVVGYEDRVLPHAHNEWLQIGADLGVPGIILFAAWHLAALFMTVQIWRHGDSFARAVALSTLAGFAAHGVFGLGDAIALWDRFAFVYWWLLGLMTGQYVVTMHAWRATQPAREKAVNHPFFPQVPDLKESGS